MKVLLIGAGGREHALAWKLKQSPRVEKLWCTPGNAGICSEAECLPADPGDVAAVVALAEKLQPDLTVVGPELPLVNGLADAFAARKWLIVGPNQRAAQLEGSKTFTKELADAASIPTAMWERFDDIEQARAFVRKRGVPIVIKADGLAGGKGVTVATTEDEALTAIDTIMDRKAFGEAAIVIEECLAGEEVSLFALCDGETALLLGSAQDHKRVGEGDTGPNTGGMGAYSPVPSFPPRLEEACLEAIIRPALREMVRRGTPFRGILFAGLMLTDEGAKLIEFNVRFGDPECQVLLARLQSDLLPALQAACDGELGDFDLRWTNQAAVAVVMAANGYPDAPATGSVINGLNEAAAVQGVTLFHAGTRAAPDGTIQAAGGRVLTVCASAADVSRARTKAYAAVDALDWPQGFCRRDIAARAVE